MNTRGPWQGARTIALLNWPFYAAALLVVAASWAAAWLFPFLLVQLLCTLALLGCGWFLVGSLGVSHLVYDRSDLYHLGWIDRVLPATHDRLVFCHAGFDDLSPALRQKLPATAWTILDHYDPALMTEPSIHRARRLFPSTPETVPAAFDRWPVDSGSTDAVFGLLAIHELRSEAERSRWFAEARRSLRGGGRIILAEHLRDWPNFLAFGPGFLHFHTSAGWRRCWEREGLRAIDEFSITPWVRIFVLAPL